MNRAPDANGWVALTDVQWMNIVNHDHAYEGMSKDDAVHAAVKATEAKLREINGAVAGIWIACADQLPEPGDYSVLAYWARNGGMDMVHATEYFAPIANGLDAEGKQQMSFWYLHSGVTHWMAMPAAPTTQAAGPMRVLIDREAGSAVGGAP